MNFLLTDIKGAAHAKSREKEISYTKKGKQAAKKYAKKMGKRVYSRKKK